jgi:GNAT superfamily N-acetyltransferase
VILSSSDGPASDLLDVQRLAAPITCSTFEARPAGHFSLSQATPQLSLPASRSEIIAAVGEGMNADTVIEEWRPGPAESSTVERDIDMLADVLHAVVHGGAGVSFFVPFSVEDARAFWREKVLPGVRAGTRRVVVARRDSRIVGTVQLDLALPPNQRHRAEVAKLLVHPAARRQGIARALMIALEAVAQSEGRSLLTLDTVTGASAEPLYRSLGYVTVGVIPRYARAALTPDLEPTTIMYKELTPASRQP